MRRGRGRLSAIEQLPDVCDPIIAWAAQELANRKMTQLEIYECFKRDVEKLQAEHGLTFPIPSLTAFNTYSVRLAATSRRLDETRQIAATLAQRMDANSSDKLTMVTAEAIKTLVYEMFQNKGEGGLSPKAVKELGDALRAANAAELASSSRRLKIEAEEKIRKAEQNLAARAEEAIATLAAAEPGVSGEAISRLRYSVLGLKPPSPSGKS